MTVTLEIRRIETDHDRFSLRMYVDGVKTVCFWANTVEMALGHHPDYITVRAYHDEDEDMCKLRVDEVRIDDRLEWVQDEDFKTVRNLGVKEVSE